MKNKTNEIKSKHPGGRPRSVSLPPDDMIKLGKEMIKWVEENQPIHLKEWYTIHKGFTYNQWKSFLQREEFIPYYEKALAIVGLKYIDGTVDKSIAQRFLRVYFKDLKEIENEQVEYEAKVKREDQVQVDPAILSQYNQMIQLLSSLQSSAKRDSSNISNEQKS